ncbi:signal peptidase I [Gloeothece verrucosa]|uniref:Signal peptidase I n=1 Tax=Gloeothece verrucosa (strain PCC 7822) TaxID=497965 RepID=E0U9J5_GLOV7|nr:signal peptidase I [Gloeothece verrucosa]ADN13796.1 signal peptidase I [Gloeothece verrucosa PCC 7822]
MTLTNKLSLKQLYKQAYFSPVKNFSKDPWLAVNLSMFFPGMGQLYAGKLSRGFLLIVLQIFVIFYALESIFSPQGKIMTGLICLFLSVVIYGASILDALLCVYYQQEDTTGERIPRKNKNPWFAVFASRILPGLGQLYNQNVLWGMVFLSAFLICWKLEGLFPSLLSIPPTLAAIATYHAYISFPYPNQRFHLSQRSLLAIIVGLIFAWGLISSYIPIWINQKIELFIIPSESMQPTLQVGDRVFVSKSKTYQPQRGDVVVFRPSDEIKAVDPKAEFYIKRLIGKPGDKVLIDHGIVSINDQPLKENYIAQPPNYQWGPAIIPSGQYFVLGDNRNNSFDSHAWGFLPKEDIFGQAYKIYWPMNRVKSLIRE